MRRTSIDWQDFDEFILQASLRLPDLSPFFSGFYGLQIGFSIPNSYPERSCFLWFYQKNTGRYFTLDVYKGDNTSIGWSRLPPGNLLKYPVRLKYKPASGLFHVDVRGRSTNPWTRLLTIDLDMEWNLPAGMSFLVRPFLTVETNEIRIYSPGSLWFDNFQVTRFRP